MPITRARYNYTWDWTPRLVEIGIAGGVALRRVATTRIELDALQTGMNHLSCRARAVNAAPESPVTLVLADGERTLRHEILPASRLAAGVRLENLPVECWQVNGTGTPRCYTLQLEVAGAPVFKRRIGFREIRRTANPGAPTGADPWLFVVNGKPLFIQGIDWTPLLPNYADSPE